MTLNLYLTQYLKINSQWNRDRHVKPKTSRRRHRVLGLGEEFLETKQNPQSIKEKNDRLDFFRTENFHSLKDIVQKTNGQAPAQEQISAKPTSVRGLESRTFKELPQHKNLKTYNSISKGGKDLKRHVTRH